MKPRNSMLGILIGSVIAACGARAGDSTPIPPAESNLVKQANAPISNILQIRLQDTYVPRFTDLHGQGNTFAMAVTMPTAVTLPGGSTGFGDLRFLDIAVLDAGHKILWGLGPTLVFPTASERT